MLNCFADSNPRSVIQWFQQLPSGIELTRGYESKLSITDLEIEHSGNFFCIARSNIRGKTIKKKSNTVSVKVHGPPKISDVNSIDSLVVMSGATVIVDIPFCSDPFPSVNWLIGLPSSLESRLRLSSGARYGRFSACLEASDHEHCFNSVLEIHGAHPSDSGIYVAEVENEKGGVKKSVTLTVIDDSPNIEFLVAIIVGSILSVLILGLIILYAVKANNVRIPKCKSETRSNHTDSESCGSINIEATTLPPDAIYIKTEEHDNALAVRL